LQELLQGALQEDINHQLGISRAYQRTGPRDQRNGYYTRRLETQRGTLPALRVPRSRQGTYTPAVFARYQRRSAEVDELICQMFRRGVATRQVGRLLVLLSGPAASASAVSRVTRVPDAQVAQFHQRALPDHYRYLLLDGIRLRCQGAPHSRKVVVLVAYGITAEGRRESVDFCQAPGESAAEWSRFLNRLHRRGLHGEALHVVTTDAAPGLLAAVDLVYPRAQRRRGWVHRLRNLSHKLPRRHRQACLQGTRAIYLAPTPGRPSIALAPGNATGKP